MSPFALNLLCLALGVALGGGTVGYSLRAWLRRSVKADLEARLKADRAELEARAERIESIRDQALIERDQAKREANAKIQDAKQAISRAEQRAETAERGLVAERKRRQNASAAYARKKRQAHKRAEHA